MKVAHSINISSPWDEEVYSKTLSRKQETGSFFLKDFPRDTLRAQDFAE